MRVLLGLAALAAAAAPALGQTLVTPNTGNGALAVTPSGTSGGVTALAKINLYLNTAGGSTVTTISPTGAGYVNSGSTVTSTTFTITLPNAVTTLVWQFTTNQYTAQMQYRWAPNYALGASYTCDPCSGGTATSCSTALGAGTTTTGAGTTPAQGYSCANLLRQYTMTNLALGNAGNFFSVNLFDLPQGVAQPDVSSYSFVITRSNPTVILGDPQIVGMQGQDFQVHGVPDEIFNIVTYPTVQINARFTYLESGVCHDNFTACFAHPGTYISEEGIRIGKDKVRVSAGSFKKGLTVHVNGKKIKSNTDLKSGAVEMVNHRRVVIHTDVMRVAISNSDNFMNQELELMDDKLVSLGAKRVTLKDNQKFHSEVPLHGLQGQTWRNVEYPSGLEYEGSIMDYHVVDGNLFGTDFVFNQFQS